MINFIILLYILLDLLFPYDFHIVFLMLVQWVDEVNNLLRLYIDLLEKQKYFKLLFYIFIHLNKFNL